MLAYHRASQRLIQSLSNLHQKFYFSTTASINSIPKKNKLPPRPKWLIKEEEIDEKFIKGGRGPGGQKINKSNSKVQLTHLPTGIVVTCQYSRSQESNRKRAREILALRLDEQQNGEKSRTSIVNERKTKLKQSKTKKANRKYRNLQEEKNNQLVENENSDQSELSPEEEFELFLKQYSKEKEIEVEKDESNDNNNNNDNDK
ncbi:RF-1 domain-containing protein [Scheffersomyces amazonensis]|uniref:RF-1 domain-containing protein n=1 Tax=Scheffersomyces amazonensis TaxID=1078765 RepID=UPI00315C554D